MTKLGKKWICGEIFYERYIYNNNNLNLIITPNQEIAKKLENDNEK